MRNVLFLVIGSIMGLLFGFFMGSYSSMEKVLENKEIRNMRSKIESFENSKSMEDKASINCINKIIKKDTLILGVIRDIDHLTKEEITNRLINIATDISYE